MRFLDIAIAIMVGTAAIAGLGAWSPAKGDNAAHGHRVASAARASILEFVEEKGIPWFIATPAAGVCSALAAASNSTFVLGGQVGPSRCPQSGAGPPAAQLSFRVPGAQVKLAAWSSARA